MKNINPSIQIQSMSGTHTHTKKNLKKTTPMKIITKLLKFNDKKFQKQPKRKHTLCTEEQRQKQE